MKTVTVLLILAAASAALPVHAQTIAFVGGTVHTAGPAGTLENATVLIEDGRITSVGPDPDVPTDARRIDASGKIVTPGLIDAHGYLGIVEVSLVAETADHQPVGPTYAAAFEIADAINPRSMLIPVNPCSQ